MDWHISLFVDEHSERVVYYREDALYNISNVYKLNTRAHPLSIDDSSQKKNGSVVAASLLIFLGDAAGLSLRLIDPLLFNLLHSSLPSSSSLSGATDVWLTNSKAGGCCVPCFSSTFMRLLYVSKSHASGAEGVVSHNGITSPF